MTTTRTELQPGQRLLLYVLKSHADETGKARVSMRDLTIACGWKNRSVTRRHMRELERAGIVTTAPVILDSCARDINVYTING